MPVLLLLTLLVTPFQAQAKPAPAPSLTGKWTMAIDIQGTTATPSLELVQDGEKITGTYAGRYGKFQLTGTLKGRALVFTFNMSAEGTDVQMTFKGEVAADFQSMKGEADMAGAGEASWSAKRTPASLSH
jgi:hypothetical protein